MKKRKENTLKLTFAELTKGTEEMTKQINEALKKISSMNISSMNISSMNISSMNISSMSSEQPNPENNMFGILLNVVINQQNVLCQQQILLNSFVLDPNIAGRKLEIKSDEITPELRFIESKALENKWFIEFIKSTDQKERTVKALKSLLKVIKSKNILPSHKIKVLDFGSGEGAVSIPFLHKLSNLDIDKIKYTALDAEQDNLNRIEKGVSTIKKIKYKARQGDCFGDESLPNNKINILLASHILYWAPNIKTTLSNLLSSLNNNGIMVLIHENSSSDLNQLRERFNENIKSNTVSSIDSFIKGNNIKSCSHQLDAFVTFNSIIDEDFVAAVKEFAKLGVCPEDNHIIKDINLLEFAVQKPLSELETEGRLEEYLDTVISLIKLQENRLIVRSDMHIALSRDHTKEAEQLIIELENNPSWLQHLKPSSLVSEVKLEEIRKQTIGYTQDRS